MKTDITDRTDIDLLMEKFYSQAMVDEVIGYIFTDVAGLELEVHLPIIGDFWESVLFGAGKYQQRQRSPMIVHKDLDNKEHLTREHFDRWLLLFEKSVNEEFQGTNCEMIKMRARAISARMVEFLTTTE